MKFSPFLFPCLLLFPLAPATCLGAENAPPPSLASAAEQLTHLVESFVARDEIVGGELLVLHRGEPLVHRAFGFADREAKRPMELNTFFAIRSMTKPFTGMAAQLLIDAGKLELDAPVARYLPAFDNDKSRAITLRHLLTHRSGLPLAFASDPARPLAAYSGLRELADLSGQRGPDFAPGSRYLYSDAGSDALGAVVAAVSGRSLEDFVTERILQPLGLRETFPEKQAVDASHRGRTASRYSGMTGNWIRYWQPDDAPLYPFLKGSGGLHSTPRDYARFLEFWLRRGADARAPLLSPEAFARALAPASLDVTTTGFTDAAGDYGQMWMSFRPRNGEARAFAFGHSGSDGTLGYAFPDKELIVCFFTQTRGSVALRTFEEALSHLFLAPNPAAFARLVQPAPPRRHEEYLGLYSRDQRSQSVGAMIEVEGRLAFELPNRQVMLLRTTDDPDRWMPDRAPSDSVLFRREAGRVIGFALTTRGNTVEAVRFQPAPDLPTADELMALRLRSAAPGAVAKLLPLRVVSTLETQGRQLPVTLLVDREGRSVQELDLGEAGMMRTWIAGDRVWRQTPGNAAPVELTGLERTQERESAMLAGFSDWRGVYRDVIVLGRETFDGSAVFRVRTVPKEGLASTKLVNAETGAVVAELGIAFVPGAGLLPTETRHADFREVGGVVFPFSQTTLVGGAAGSKIQVTVSEIQPNASVAAAAFAAITSAAAP